MRASRNKQTGCVPKLTFSFSNESTLCIRDDMSNCFCLLWPGVNAALSSSSFAVVASVVVASGVVTSVVVTSGVVTSVVVASVVVTSVVVASVVVASGVVASVVVAFGVVASGVVTTVAYRNVHE